MNEPVPFLDLNALHAPIQEQLQQALNRVLVSGRFSGGPEVEGLEREFADYCGVAHAVACSSGTASLHLALRALEVDASHEVITVANTFVATAWAVRYCGARPRLVDVDPDSRNLDARHLEAALRPNTRAIMPVHLYGRPADMAPIREFAQRHGLFVIEDAAQAHGAIQEGRRVGSLGDVACFSFYPGKNLGAVGEGGMLVTEHAGIAARARMLRDHAQAERYHHTELGYNYRMDALQAAALRVKLPHLDSWNARRRNLAQRYDHLLAGVPGLRLPSGPNRILHPESSPEEGFNPKEGSHNGSRLRSKSNLKRNSEHDAQRNSERNSGLNSKPELKSDVQPRRATSTCVHHLYVIQHAQRDALQRSLQEQGIQTGLHYPTPVHLQPAFADLGHQRGDFPISESLADTCLSLPMSPTLRDADIDRVVAALHSALGKAKVRSTPARALH